jgi:hypothetical protein
MRREDGEPGPQHVHRRQKSEKIGEWEEIASLTSSSSGRRCAQCSELQQAALHAKEMMLDSLAEYANISYVVSRTAHLQLFQHADFFTSSIMSFAIEAEISTSVDYFHRQLNAAFQMLLPRSSSDPHCCWELCDAASSALVAYCWKGLWRGNQEERHGAFVRFSCAAEPDEQDQEEECACIVLSSLDHSAIRCWHDSGTVPSEQEVLIMPSGAKIYGKRGADSCRASILISWDSRGTQQSIDKLEYLIQKGVRLGEFEEYISAMEKCYAVGHPDGSSISGDKNSTKVNEQAEQLRLEISRRHSCESQLAAALAESQQLRGDLLVLSRELRLWQLAMLSGNVGSGSEVRSTSRDLRRSAPLQRKWPALLAPPPPRWDRATLMQRIPSMSLELAGDILQHGLPEEVDFFMPQLLGALHWGGEGLVDSLLDRATSSLRLSTNLYWCLRSFSARKDATFSHLEHGHAFIFRSALSKLSADASHGPVLSAAQVYVDYMFDALSSAIGKTAGKSQALRKAICDGQLDNVAELQIGIKIVPLPLSVEFGSNLIHLTGISPNTACCLNSSNHPGVVEAILQKSPSLRREELLGGFEDLQALSLAAEMRGNRLLLLKIGDDLRWDRLAIQLLSLMDGFLRDAGLDLMMSPYDVLPVARDAGIVQFLTGALPLSALTQQGELGLFHFMRNRHPDPCEPAGVGVTALDNFTRSLAGLCVSNHILGVGDRHLDNLLILPDARIVSVDFSFLFGKDPKPLPPPFRLTKHMMACLGGPYGPGFSMFRVLCCRAFRCIRSSSAQLMNITSICLASWATGCAREEEKAAMALESIRDRLQLSLSNEKADNYFMGLIERSRTAVAPRVWDHIHRLRVSSSS